MSKGRMLPSSLSRSAAYSKLPLEAKIIYPLLVANADDQGRLTADPVGFKLSVCPSVDEVSTADIPGILHALEEQGFVTAYKDDGGQAALQIRSWWVDQSLSWAYPSEYCPPAGWDDRLRFRQMGLVITINWQGVNNGSKGKTPPDIRGNTLPDIADFLMPSSSLAIAIGKALGKAPGKVLTMPLGEALPKENPADPQADSLPEALGKALPNPITQHNTTELNTIQDNPPPSGGPGGGNSENQDEPEDEDEQINVV